MKSKLKPCPFCGGNIELAFDFEDMFVTKSYDSANPAIHPTCKQCATVYPPIKCSDFKHQIRELLFQKAYEYWEDKTQ